ncbi:MAG: hypothetical protein MJ105_02990 [Lachnospiraceae bacterium]|nr:hypothetical protein [Lachnospiraceae bacterium]
MAFKTVTSVIKRFVVRRKYKDHLFRRVFSDKKDMLSLYNALNHTNYDNPDDLEVTTLEDAIYMSMKNDLSFIIASSLNLYEHQSSINPNMPLRGFLYFAKLYEAYIKLHHLDIYGRKRLSLPFPQYVVFYNGEEKASDEQIIKLSDLYVVPGNLSENPELAPCLECTARIININYGRNDEILNSCKNLHDYSYFIHEVRQNRLQGKTLERAIDEAVDACIENDILKDFLLKHKSEVSNMLLFTYDEKLHKKTIREEGREEGLAQGIEQGIERGRTQLLIAQVHDGEITIESAVRRLGISEDEFRKML